MTKTQRIDSTAFRRGVRSFKAGGMNPYNSPQLRDEWFAGRKHAERSAGFKVRETQKGAA